MNRREMLGGIGALTALGATSTAARAAEPTAGRGPWWLLAPHKSGDEVGFGWRLSRLDPHQRGAWVLTLVRDGVNARVHLCAHDGRPKGVAHTGLMDLILMDGGQGEKPTTESIGRVLRKLAQTISSNELSEGVDEELALLLTHDQRVDRYGPETLL